MSFLRKISVGAILFVASIGSSYGGIFSAAGTWMIGPKHISLVSLETVVAILVLNKDSTLTYESNLDDLTYVGIWEVVPFGGIKLKFNPDTNQEVIFTVTHLPNDQLLINTGSHRLDGIQRTPQFQHITIDKIRALAKTKNPPLTKR